MKYAKCQHIESWEDFPIIQKNLNDLWQSVPTAETFKGKAFFEPIKQDIVQNGLMFPLIVVECTYSQLRQVKARYGNRILPLPQEDPTKLVYHAIWGGSNRYQILNELGFDVVDCVILPNGDFNGAHGLQRKQRKPFLSRFY